MVLLAAGAIVRSERSVEAKTATKEVTTQNGDGPVIEVQEDSSDEDELEEYGLKRVGTFGKLHLFGYGDIQYHNYLGTQQNKIDVKNLTIGIGYDFTDKIKMRSEIDFEHGFNEPEIEFAYIDFLFKSWVNARAGAILVPMGILNEHHEPTLYYSVDRPLLYRNIIPTEWPGIGGGFHGHFGQGFDYELYGLSSLTAVQLNENGTVDFSFTGSDGFDDAHTLGEGPGQNFGAAGRLEYKGMPGLRIGTSIFAGDTGQGVSGVGGAFLTMIEGDAKYSFQGIDLEGIVVFTELNDAGNINNVLIAADPTFNNFVASQMIGWYLEADYHTFHHLLPDTNQDLVLFTRYEKVNTQLKMPKTFAADPANDRYLITSGVSYLPIPQVALKADFVVNQNTAYSGANKFDLGVAFYY
jgi:hypothetical protein